MFALYIVSMPTYGQTYLTEEEMMEKLVGHKVSAVSVKDGKSIWTEYYQPHKKGKPKGKIEGTWKGDPYKGSWKIKKDRFCFTYPKWPEENYCAYIEMVDADTIRTYKKDGTLIHPEIKIVE